VLDAFRQSVCQERDKGHLENSIIESVDIRTADSTLALRILLTHNVKTWRFRRPDVARLRRLHISFPRYMGWTPLENP